MWIEWIPEMAGGIYSQLLAEAGKHSGVIWMVEKPPYARVAITPVTMEGVKRYVEQGGVPVGWIDVAGRAHTFKLEAPFEPPNFEIDVLSETGPATLNYADFQVNTKMIYDLYKVVSHGEGDLRKSGWKPQSPIVPGNGYIN